MRNKVLLDWWLSGGSEPSPVDAILGTLSDPVTSASTLATTGTFFAMECLPVVSTIKSLKLYSNNAGTVKLKLAAPVKGAGFTVTDIQTLTVAAGLNTYSVEGGTLNEFEIPPFALVGVKCNALGLVAFASASSAAGYLSATGDVSGANIAMSTVLYRDEIQMQFTVEYTRSGNQSYIIDEDFAGTVLPAYGVNNTTTPWTFPGEKITSAGTGLANFFDTFPTLNIDRHTIEREFEFKASGDRFAIYKKPILGGSSVLEGTIGEADLNNNQLVLYQSWNGSTTLPSVRTTLTLTNLTLATGVRYKLALRKESRVNHLTITRVSDGVTQTLTHDSTVNALSGFCYGRPGMAALAGTIDIFSARLLINKPDAGVLIIGDSITEGSGTTDALCYAQLILDARNGDGVFDGDGGTDSTNCLRRLRHDLRITTPRYVVVFIGRNNANSDAQTTAFQTDIVNIRNEIINAGAIPVICTLIPSTNGTFNTRIGTMNTFVLAQGWTNVVNIHTAFSVGGDGVTQNASLMFDDAHPNDTGHALLKSTIQAAVPQMF